MVKCKVDGGDICLQNILWSYISLDRRKNYDKISNKWKLTNL